MRYGIDLRRSPPTPYAWPCLRASASLTYASISRSVGVSIDKMSSSTSSFWFTSAWKPCRRLAMMITCPRLSGGSSPILAPSSSFSANVIGCMSRRFAAAAAAALPARGLASGGSAEDGSVASSCARFCDLSCSSAVCTSSTLIRSSSRRFFFRFQLSFCTSTSSPSGPSTNCGVLDDGPRRLPPPPVALEPSGATDGERLRLRSSASTRSSRGNESLARRASSRSSNARAASWYSSPGRLYSIALRSTSRMSASHRSKSNTPS
mmetsp:Transcript_10896/g.29189  ORF Transcript_10896/g.29189 Transcript_10896/m.29189 type:complete len:264 (+) Transcript_10896:587-1378(+)